MFADSSALGRTFGSGATDGSSIRVAGRAMTAACGTVDDSAGVENPYEAGTETTADVSTVKAGRGSTTAVAGGV